jgi:hypothetical protein
MVRITKRNAALRENSILELKFRYISWLINVLSGFNMEEFFLFIFSEGRTRVGISPFCLRFC